MASFTLEVELLWISVFHVAQPAIKSGKLQISLPRRGKKGVTQKHPTRVDEA